jgi:hypothetical protein
MLLATYDQSLDDLGSLKLEHPVDVLNGKLLFIGSFLKFVRTKSDEKS